MELINIVQYLIEWNKKNVSVLPKTEYNLEEKLD